MRVCEFGSWVAGEIEIHRFCSSQSLGTDQKLLFDMNIDNPFLRHTREPQRRDKTIDGRRKAKSETGIRSPKSQLISYPIDSRIPNSILWPTLQGRGTISIICYAMPHQIALDRNTKITARRPPRDLDKHHGQVRVPLRRNVTSVDYILYQDWECHRVI